VETNNHNFYCFLTVKKGPLEEWEIEILEENYTIYGNQWSRIVSGVKGRSPLQAKNHFNAENKKMLA